MQTASTRHPRTPDTSIGQEPTPTQRRLRLPAEDAIRAFDDFVEDCTTLACLSVLNTLAQDDGAQDDLVATGARYRPNTDNDCGTRYGRIYATNRPACE